jgi:hypothetical protein
VKKIKIQSKKYKIQSKKQVQEQEVVSIFFESLKDGFGRFRTLCHGRVKIETFDELVVQPGLQIPNVRLTQWRNFRLDKGFVRPKLDVDVVNR